MTACQAVSENQFSNTAFELNKNTEPSLSVISLTCIFDQLSTYVLYLHQDLSELKFSTLSEHTHLRMPCYIHKNISLGQKDLQKPVTHPRGLHSSLAAPFCLHCPPAALPGSPAWAQHLPGLPLGVCCSCSSSEAASHELTVIAWRYKTRLLCRQSVTQPVLDLYVGFPSCMKLE